MDKWILDVLQWLAELIKTEGVGFASIFIYTFITLKFLGYMKQRDKDVTDQRAEEMKQAQARDEARDEQNTKLLDLMARTQNNAEALRAQIEKTNQTLIVMTNLLREMSDTNHSDQVQTTSAINVNSAKLDTLVQSTQETTEATRDMIGKNEELTKQIAELITEVKQMTIAINEGVNLGSTDHDLLVSIQTSNQLLLDKLSDIETLTKQEVEVETVEAPKVKKKDEETK
jgi:hypothetical protein